MVIVVSCESTRMLWWIRADAFMFCFVTDHQLLGTVLMIFCELILFLVIVQDQEKYTMLKCYTL